MNTHVERKSHKYGIEVLASTNDALCTDKDNGNMFWTNVINLEISNVGIAFEVLKKGRQAPPGWRKSSGHIIFDVKMNFTRKARWVNDGHQTPDLVHTKLCRHCIQRKCTNYTEPYSDAWNRDPCS